MWRNGQEEEEEDYLGKVGVFIGAFLGSGYVCLGPLRDVDGRVLAWVRRAQKEEVAYSWGVAAANYRAILGNLKV